MTFAAFGLIAQRTHAQGAFSSERRITTSILWGVTLSKFANPFGTNVIVESPYHDVELREPLEESAAGGALQKKSLYHADYKETNIRSSSRTWASLKSQLGSREF